jgi:hypothetical protein
MGKFSASLLIGLGIGLAMACLHDISGARIGFGLAVKDRALLDRRFSDLENSVALERNERQALADEFAGLRDSIASLSARSVGDDEELRSDPLQRFATASGDDVRIARLANRTGEPFSDFMPRNPEALDQFLRQQQLDRLASAGFPLGRAQTILQREGEIEVEALRARYAATQTGATPQEVANITPLALLRSELGDADFAKYLEARGRPTSISVREVLRNSPAEIAGLRAGDEIVAYDGQRVFAMNELTALAYGATVGEAVPLRVIREGQSIQVYIQAGPIGITAGGQSSRL